MNFPLVQIRRENPSLPELIEKARTPDTKERRFIEQRLKVPINKFRDYGTFLEVGCKKVWATYRACHLKASTLMTTGFAVRKSGEEGNLLENPRNAAIQGLASILSRPNKWDTWEELIYQWAFHISLTGNAIWVKDEIDGKGRPTALYPLIPQFVKIVPHETEKIAEYIYHVNGQTISFSPEEIIHFKRPHPCNVYWGLGEIEPSQPLFNNFINRDKFEEKFIENGAMPSGLLTYRGVGGEEGPASIMDLDEEEWGKIKDFWRQEYSGKNNAGKTVLLTGEWKYQKLGLTHVEMESLEKEKHTVREIFMNHGVPGSIAGYERAANFATSRQDEINFRKYEILPLLHLLQGKLNTPGVLIANYDPNWKLRYNLSGLIDIKAVWQDYEGLVRYGGMTLNEVREKMGLQRGEDPSLDMLTTEQTRIPLQMAGLQISEGDFAADDKTLRMPEDPYKEGDEFDGYD